MLDDARNPMTAAQRREKFLGCTEGRLAPDASGRMFDALERIDSSTDLSERMRPLRELQPPV